MLVDPQVRDRRGRGVQHGIGPGSERVMGDRPGHADVPGGLGGVTPRSAISPAHCSLSRDRTRAPGGTTGIRSVKVLHGHEAFPHFNRRATAVSDRPYLNRAVRPGLNVGNPQPRNAEHRGRRIVEHDDCGSPRQANHATDRDPAPPRTVFKK